MSRAVLLLIFFCGLAGAIDLDIPQLIYLRHKDISKQFLKTIELSRPPQMDGSHILYGHPQYGFFSVRPQFVSDRKMQVEIIPPGYRYPILFYTRHPRRGLQPFASRHFKSPVPAFFDALQGTATRGKMSTVFLSLCPGMLTYKNTGSLHKDYSLDTVTIVNRLGEVVWLHLPRMSAKRQAEKTSLAKPMDKGLLAVLIGHDHFETVDFKGNVHTQFSIDSLNRRTKLDHDFIRLPGGEFLAIGTEFKFIRLPRSQVPIISFEASQGFKRTPFFSRPRKIRFNTLVKFDPFSGVQSRPLWRSIDAVSPHRSRDYLATHGTLTGPAIEFSHANSLEYQAGEGFLVSLGRLNRLVLLDEAFNLKWTIGSSPKDTYRFPIPLRGFRFPHDAKHLSNGNILLMDDLGRHPNRSRILELRLDPAAGGLITENTFTPDLPLVLGGRGGAYRLPNGNTLAYFPTPYLTDDRPNASLRPSPWHYLIEFDQKTHREVARVKFLNDFSANQAIITTGYRAEPLESIGLESYVGDKLPR